MTSPAVPNVFSDDDEIEEVPLDPSPLVSVVVQIRFPAPSMKPEDDFIPSLHALLRDAYPVLREEREVGAVIGPEGVVPLQRGRIWRLHDPSSSWRVALASEFVALDTSSYTSRADLVSRVAQLADVLSSVDPHVSQIDRLGVRYINRLIGPDATDGLSTSISSAAYGFLGLTDVFPPNMELVAGLSQGHFKLDGPEMQARWGKLPPNAVFAPGLDAVDLPSWVLDIDVFFEGEPLEVSKAQALTEQAAVHAYHFFRWAFDESFIEARRANLGGSR